MKDMLKKIKNKIFKRYRRSKYYFPIMKKLYTIMRIVLPMDKNLIVFESNVAKSLGDSPKAIYDKMQEKDLPYKYVWIYNGSDPLFTDNTKTVIRLGFKYYYYLARAGYWVNNQNFPTYLVKRKKTVYLQTWHGTPLKKMQNDLDVIIGRNATYLERVNFAVSQWDYLISPSSYATDCFKTAFDYKKEVLEVGYPRNDLFYQNDESLNRLTRNVRQRLGLESEFRQIILYAPTFRDDSLNKFDLALDLERFTEELSDDYLLLVRGHMATGQKINIPEKFTGDILNVSSYANIQELYLISDICITDYSSVMFDFANLKRPLIFFTYDLEHYKDNLRGFYMDFINEAPGPLVKTTEELIEAVKKVSNQLVSTKYTDFINKYCYLEDGKASERTIEKVFDINLDEVKDKKQEIEVLRYTDERVYLTHSSNSFNIKLSTYQDPLVIQLESGSTQIDLIDNNYSINKELLGKLFTEERGQAILGGISNTLIYVEEFITSGLLIMEVDEDRYYLYSNNKRQLTINKNILPDLSGYYLKHRITKQQITNEKLIFDFEIITLLSPNIKINSVLIESNGRLKKVDLLNQMTSEVISSGVFKHSASVSYEKEFLNQFIEELSIHDNELIQLELGFEIVDEANDYIMAYDQFWMNEEKSFTEKSLVQDKYFLSMLSADDNGKLVYKASRVPISFYQNEILQKNINLDSYFSSNENNLSEVELFFCKMSFWCLWYQVEQIIEVDASNDHFIINGDNVVTPIYLVNESNVIKLPLVNENNYMVSKKDIKQIIGQSKSIAVVDGNYEPIPVNSHQQLPANRNLEFSSLKDNYFLYKSVTNSLRISKNAIPAYKSYYINHSTENVSVKKDKFMIDMTIRTMFFELESVLGKVRLRGAKEVSEVSGEIINSVRQGNGCVVSQVRLSFTADNILEVARNTESRLYNYDIFDFLFSFKLKNQKVNDFNLTIKFGDIVNNTIHISNSDMCLFFYPTLIGGNLSAKMTLISEEVYDFYEERLDNLTYQKVNSKPMVLVTEYPHKAQDTGLAYFKYLVDNHSDTLDVYYLISDITKDFANLADYQDNIVYYKTKEHVDVFLDSDILVSSHGTNYACPVVDSKSKLVLQNKLKVFLQHGILGVRDMTHLYGKNEDSPFTNLFVTSSERERDMVINEFGYKPNEVVLSGLPRFDRLFKSLENRTSQLKSVLIMPSWREGLNNKTSAEFKKSLFFKSFDELLNDPDLKVFAEKNQIEFKFYLHTNFQQYTGCFKSDFVEIISEGSKTVQDLLIESDCLITDYSSVGLDFALMKKPIIYYQFDTNIKNSRNTLNHHFFPGEIKRTVRDIKEEFNYLIEHPEMREQHVNKLDNLYLYRDTHANDRIFEAMMREFDSKKIV